MQSPSHTLQMKFHVKKKNKRKKEKDKARLFQAEKGSGQGLGTAVSLGWGARSPRWDQNLEHECPKGGLGPSCRASGPLLPLVGSSAHMGFFGILLSACSLLQVKCFFFSFSFFFFSSPIFKSLDCLCGFCNISVCPPVAVHPLLRHLVADEVISGHEMLCVSDNVFE